MSSARRNRASSLSSGVTCLTAASGGLSPSSSRSTAWNSDIASSMLSRRVGVFMFAWGWLRLLRDARAYRLVGAGGRGCDGYAGAVWATRGPAVLRPQEASARLLESPLRGSPGPCGVPWVALRRPRGGDFCPGPLFGLPPGTLQYQAIAPSVL